MAVNYTDFEKIWASTSPLTPYSFSDANYKRGWDFVGSTPPSRQMWDAFMQHADEKLQYLYLHEDVPVGHEYFTFNPNVPQGSLPLFGGEYSRKTYSALWSWVQEQTGYLKTEAEWQTLAASNNGNVPYYSDGDGSTTFRVPALKCYIKAADGTVSEVGSYLAAGLPNIQGEIADIKLRSLNAQTVSGAFTADEFTQDGAANGTNWAWHKIGINASRSSSIYGNSNTVTPETVVGMWLVKAYGAIQNTGTINEQQYIDDRIATRLPLVGGTIIGNLEVNGELTQAGKPVEKINSSGTNYIRYENGLQICWGKTSNLSSSNADTYTDITIPAAFINTDYSVSLTTSIVSGGWNNHCFAVGNKTTTSIRAYLRNLNSSAYTCYFMWIAIGYWK